MTANERSRTAVNTEIAGMPAVSSLPSGQPPIQATNMPPNHGFYTMYMPPNAPTFGAPYSGPFIQAPHYGVPNQFDMSMGRQQYIEPRMTYVEIQGNAAPIPTFPTMAGTQVFTHRQFGMSSHQQPANVGVMRGPPFGVVMPPTGPVFPLPENLNEQMAMGRFSSSREGVMPPITFPPTNAVGPMSADLPVHPQVPGGFARTHVSNGSPAPLVPLAPEAPRVTRRRRTTTRAPRRTANTARRNRSNESPAAAAAPSGAEDPSTGNDRKIKRTNQGGTSRKRKAAEDDLKKPAIKSPPSSAATEKELAQLLGIKKEEGSQCCICLDEPQMYELATISCCDHKFCFGCIEKWAERENTCPLCKARFSKIDRVNKPPPKKRKKGDGPRAKNTKKVRNRDQRADISSTSGTNPLQGLFATMQANGSMPQSIAQLIFSGLGGVSGGVVTFTSSENTVSSNIPRGHPSSRAADPTPDSASPSLSSAGELSRRFSDSSFRSSLHQESSQQSLDQMLIHPWATSSRPPREARNSLVSIGRPNSLHHAAAAFAAETELNDGPSPDQDFGNLFQSVRDLNRQVRDLNRQRDEALERLRLASRRELEMDSLRSVQTSMGVPDLQVNNMVESASTAFHPEDSDDEDVVELLASAFGH